MKHFAKYHARRGTVLRQLARLKQYHTGSREDFTSDRNALLGRIVAYADRYCPYYRKLFADSGLDVSGVIDQFWKIPFLDKSTVRNNGDRIASSNLRDMIYGSGNTGGSTGEPLKFLTSISFDPEHQAFLYDMMGYDNGDRILAMDGTAIEDDLAAKGIYWKKKSKSDLPFGSMALSSLYLDKNTVSRYADFLVEFEPSIIRGYPAFVNEIATYLLDKGIRLRRPMKGVVLTSESSSATQIRNVGRAFGTSVHLQYGHSEAALFGYTVDDSYEYYCSPFYGYVEVVDDSGSHVKPGEMGEVICTGFYNYAMPFIRYRTGDLAVFSGDIDGIVRLKCVSGRTQDYVYDGAMNRTLLTALVFGLHYRAFSNIVKWQIVQDKPGEVTIHIVRDRHYNPDDEEEIRSNFFKIAGIKTVFDYSGQIKLTKRGKSLFLVQNLVNEKV
jgi:phenylacetate-CoA ligase